MLKARLLFLYFVILVELTTNGRPYEIFSKNPTVGTGVDGPYDFVIGGRV